MSNALGLEPIGVRAAAFQIRPSKPSIPNQNLPIFAQYIVESLRLPRKQAELLKYHLTLLDNAGLITIQAKLSGAVWQIGQITWASHDFLYEPAMSSSHCRSVLDTIRDPAIWCETKVGVKQAGGFSLELLKALAKGLIKKKIEQHTGVDLDL